MDPELYYRYYGKNPSYAPDHFTIGGFVIGGITHTVRTFDHAPADAVGGIGSIRSPPNDVGLLGSRMRREPLDDLLTNKQPAVVIGTSTPEVRRNASTVSRELEHLFSQTYADVGGFDSDDLSGDDLSGDSVDNADDADDGDYLGGNAGDNADDDADDVCDCDHSLGNQSEGGSDGASGDSIEFADGGVDETVDSIEDVDEVSQTELRDEPMPYSPDSLTSLFDDVPDDGGLGSTFGLRPLNDDQFNPSVQDALDVSKSEDTSSDRLSDLLTD